MSKEEKIYQAAFSRIENFPNGKTEEEKQSFKEFKAGMQRLAKM